MIALHKSVMPGAVTGQDTDESSSNMTMPLMEVVEKQPTIVVMPRREAT